jgi:hypothetical protein
MCTVQAIITTPSYNKWNSTLLRERQKTSPPPPPPPPRQGRGGGGEPQVWFRECMTIVLVDLVRAGQEYFLDSSTTLHSLPLSTCKVIVSETTGGNDGEVTHSTILPSRFSLATNVTWDAGPGVVDNSDSRNSTPPTLSGTAGTSGTSPAAGIIRPPTFSVLYLHYWIIPPVTLQVSVAISPGHISLGLSGDN